MMAECVDDAAVTCIEYRGLQPDLPGLAQCGPLMGNEAFFGFALSFCLSPDLRFQCAIQVAPALLTWGVSLNSCVSSVRVSSL